MRKLFMLLLIPGFLWSQGGTDEDSIEYLTRKNFKKVHDAFLTGAMIGDDEVSSLASFVSVDITKPTVTMAVTINWSKTKPFYNYGLTSLKFSGGINDGVSAVFSDEKFNTDISLRIEHSFPIKGLTSMKYVPEYAKDLGKKRDSINALKNNNLLHIQLIEAEIDQFENTEGGKEISVNREYLELKQKLNELKALKFDEEIKKLELESKWSTVKAGWVNFYGSYSTQNIRLYDASEIIENQITKITPENYEFGLGFNYYYNQRNDLGKNIKYHWANIFNGVYSITYSYAKTNNIGELSSSKIVTETEIAQHNNDTRFIESTINAYLLSSYDSFKRHKIAINANKKIIDKLHFHLFYDYNSIEDSEKFEGSYQNLGLGIIFGLRKKDDPTEKTHLNIEPFILFKDLGDKFEETGDQFYKRSFIGVRTTIPFDNLLKK